MALYSNNDGNQKITWNYLQEAESQSFNNLLRAIMQPGIYEGGLLSKVNDAEVSIAPYTAVVYAVNDSTVAVKVDTADSYNVAVSAATPIVVLRYEWYNSESNYVQAVALDQATIDANDPTGDLYITVGEAIYNGATLESINYDDRENVSKDADTIVLGDTYSVNQTPTGGISSLFPGDTTTLTTIIQDIYNRLIDLSGAQNNAVKSRHVDKTAVSGITASNLNLGAEITYEGTTPGTQTAVTLINSVLQDIYNKIADLSGANNLAVKKRLLDLGIGTGQISLNDFVLGFAGTKDLASGFTDINFSNTDTLSSIFAKILESLYEISVSLSDNTLNSIPNLTSRLNALENEFRFSNLPNGVVIFYDSVGWVNNSTIPGWYACDGTNGTPDLRDKFVKVHSPAQHNSNPINNTSGSNYVSIAVNNLPAHKHSFSGVLTGNTGLAGKHTHTHSASNSNNTQKFPKWPDRIVANTGMRTLRTAEAGEHRHSFSASYSGETQNTGSGQALNFNPEHYRLIAIRKMS